MSNKTVPKGLPLARSRLTMVPMLMAKKSASVLMVMESSDDGGGMMSLSSPLWCLGLEENIANLLGRQKRSFPLLQRLS